VRLRFFEGSRRGTFQTLLDFDDCIGITIDYHNPLWEILSISQYQDTTQGFEHCSLVFHPPWWVGLFPPVSGLADYPYLGTSCGGMKHHAAYAGFLQPIVGQPLPQGRF